MPFGSLLYASKQSSTETKVLRSREGCGTAAAASLEKANVQHLDRNAGAAPPAAARRRARRAEIISDLSIRPCTIGADLFAGRRRASPKRQSAEPKNEQSTNRRTALDCCCLMLIALTATDSRQQINKSPFRHLAPCVLNSLNRT